MGLIIFIIILVVVVLAVVIGLVFSASVKSGKEAKAGAKNAALSSEQTEKLAQARKSIATSRQLGLRVQDQQIKDATEAVLKQAEAILATMKEQPVEISRARQFFNYYLPTLAVVLKKYVELEGSGTDVEAQKETVRSFLADMTKAFETQYTNMFKDERLDLEVETEAMQMALKREGLL